MNEMVKRLTAERDALRAELAEARALLAEAVDRLETIRMIEDRNECSSRCGEVARSYWACPERLRRDEAQGCTCPNFNGQPPGNRWWAHHVDCHERAALGGPARDEARPWQTKEYVQGAKDIIAAVPYDEARRCTCVAGQSARPTYHTTDCPARDGASTPPSSASDESTPPRR